MEVVIDFEYLKGRQNDIVVKELSVASRNVTDSFRFKSPITWRLTPRTKTGSIGTTVT